MQLHSASYVIFIWSFSNQDSFAVSGLTVQKEIIFPLCCVCFSIIPALISSIPRDWHLEENREQRRKKPVCSCILSLSNRIPQKGSIFLHLPRSTGPSNRVKHQKKAPQNTIIIPIQSCKENVNRQAGLQSCPNFPRRLVIKQKRCYSGKGFLPLVLFSLH